MGTGTGKALGTLGSYYEGVPQENTNAGQGGGLAGHQKVEMWNRLARAFNGEGKEVRSGWDVVD